MFLPLNEDNLSIVDVSIILRFHCIHDYTCDYLRESEFVNKSMSCFLLDPKHNWRLSFLAYST